ncbi:hypothetical protein D9613_005564 [Agrocybe pediades]|uniref:NAD-dependent protein deacylase n=1 Tax=Agrocybe pediades TaxID=84607 RepID=A0A8H4QYR4_9AGAR|nr:hypothetical protein D9613_005564 [Agrocybe pediades]KAF9563704.1 sirtuin 5 [Agrocybe pediades]
MAPSNNMDAFRELLASSRHIVAVAGAGLSAASGIPTFRGAGGMWRKYNAISLATPEGFKANPSLSWQFYHYRRETALRAQPNNAHRALSAFSLPTIRQQISPGSTFTLITQNVDGLSQRSNDQIAAMFPEEGNTADEKLQLIEMHGKLFDVSCTAKDCRHVEYNTKSPITEALGGTELLVEHGTLDPDIPLEDLPRCSKCGSLARPGVVWFGERPFHLDDIDKLVEKADLCVVVGTSSTVYPAAGYAMEVQENGGKVAVFNLDRSEGDEEADYLFLGPCEETLVQAFGLTIPENGKISVNTPSE